MSSTYGENLKLSVFGQSHSASVGMVLDGIPAGLPVDTEKLQVFLNRRAPGQNDWSTPRKEEDHPEFLGGILDGFTCGAPIAALIHSRNTRSGDYDNLKDCPRPGHADYTADVKYGGFQDPAGGGHFSGRLTAPVCIAGGLCKQWLEDMGIHIYGRIYSIGDTEDPVPSDILPQLICHVPSDFPAIGKKQEMMDIIARVRSRGDSVGGVVQCCIVGVPAGIGEPIFGGVESRIAQIIYGIPAVKGLEFGDGFRCAGYTGSENNDAFSLSQGIVQTQTNHCGGILGGITDGMPLIFQAAFKPTPSIAIPQKSVVLSERKETFLQIKGRHDPCIVPRAVPVVEAAAAIALYDMILGNTQAKRRKNQWI